MIVALCYFALTCFVIGPLLAHFAVVKPLVGFGVFAAGGLLCLIASIGGIVQLVRGRPVEWKALGPAFAGTLLFILAASRGAGVPRINDITTDTENPPQFNAALKQAANRGRDMGYPGEFADVQKASYPDIRPLVLQQDMHETYIRVLQAARSFPTFSLTLNDHDKGIVEGTDTSTVFRFKDDFVIEIRRQGDSCAVHMRSKSRDGRGDLGANAARIRAFLERVRKGGNSPL